MPAPTPTARQAFIGDRAANDLPWYLQDYLGIAEGGSLGVGDAIIRLPDNPCRFVMLANWNTTVGSAQTFQALSLNNLYEDSGFEIYYGFGKTLVAQLFPSQNSGLLPVNNTNQICVKARPAAAVQLWYAWFR